MTIQQTTLAAQTATDRGRRVTVVQNRHVPLVGSTMLAIGVALAAANLRPAVTSLASVLVDVRAALGVSAAWTSALTAVPALCFGFAAFAAPWLGRRLGMARAIGVSLGVLTLGLVLRVIDGPWVVLGGTFIACAGIAVSNVLVPVVVKASFPAKVGLVTGAYTAALSAGAALAAATTPRLEEFLGSWRSAVGAWALLSAAALLWWVFGARHGSAATIVKSAACAAVKRSLLRSPLAWVITVFFGLQSLFAYTVMGWLPAMLVDSGVDRFTAGMLLAVSMLLSVPVSLIVPPIAARWNSQGPMVLLLGVLSFAGILGMLVAPAAVPGLWVVLIGFGMGMFPVALLVMTLRTKSTSDTARLSAMAQSLGYLIAASGPFAFGVLREATGSWSASLVLQLVLLAALMILGVIAGRPRYV